MRFLRSVIVIMAKDLRIEARQRTALLTTVTFAILVQLIFVFARPAGELSLAAIGPSVLWVMLTFSSIVVLNRGFLLEREHGALDGILLAPVSRVAFYWGKWLANTLLVLVVLAVAFPLWVLFFGFPISLALLGVLGILILALAGFTAAGTLFAAMTARTRYAELLLPVLLLPFLIPPIFAGTSGSMRLLQGRPFEEIAGWLRILVIYDVGFLALASLLFPHVVDE